MKSNSFLFILGASAIVLSIVFMLTLYFWSDPCNGQCSIPILDEKDQEKVYADFRPEPKSYTLSNGVQLYILSTPFDEDDEVSVRIIAFRGYADESPEKRASAELSIDMAWESGLGGKNADQISALLYEEGIEIHSKVFPFITRIEATFPQEKLGRFFNLATKFIEEAHVTDTGADIVKTRMQKNIEERNKSREYNFEDVFRSLYFPSVPQLQSLKIEDMKTVQSKDADDFIHQVTADPTRFIVLVVGDVDPEKAYEEINASLGEYKPKVTSAPSRFDWNKVNQTRADEIKRLNFSVHRPGEGLTRIIFPLHVQVDMQSFYRIEFLANLIEERLRDLLKDKKGSSMGVDVSYEFPLYPHLKPATLTIQYRAFSKDNEKILQLILTNLKELKEKGPTTHDIQDVHKYIEQSDSYWRHNNEYWLDVLSNYAMWKWPFDSLISEKQPILDLSEGDIKVIVDKAFRMTDYTILNENHS